MIRNNRNGYPKVTVDLKKLRHNILTVKSMLEEQGVEMVGVIKGCNALYGCVKEFDDAGCRYIASSRIEQLKFLKEQGIKTPFMMIRVPMFSEAADVVRITEISLNSDIKVLRELNRQAEIQRRVHKVILMVDLGDLREGFFDEKELIDAAMEVERDLHNLELAGTGTNLGCYGAIFATVEKLNELVSVTEKIETVIDRTLEFVSGGTTNTLPRILKKDLPERVNLFRVGEGILLARDLQDLFGYDLSFLHKDVFRLQAEVVEVRDKPSHPIGEITFDAFGNSPKYEDRGIRKRALLGIGKVDYAYPEELIPREKGVEVVGASSDHTILDVEELDRKLDAGDIVEFDLCYSTIVFLTYSSNVKIEYQGQGI